MSKKRNKKIQEEKKEKARLANQIGLEKKYKKLQNFLKSKGIFKSKEEVIELLENDRQENPNPPKDYTPDGGILKVRSTAKNKK